MGMDEDDTAQLAFNFLGTGVDRKFEIKITQLECNNPSRYKVNK